MSKVQFDSYQEHPYWWDAGIDGNPIQLDQLAASATEIPSHADCVIAGAGYTGL